MKIWSVVKDPGGTTATLPVGAALKDVGHSVVLFTNGWADTDKTGLMEINPLSCSSAKEIMEKHGDKLPNVMITCMSSNGGVGRDLVPILRNEGVITVALQDFWGARLWTDWADPIYRPDRIVVNDDVGKKLVLQAWPEYPENHIHISGYAAHDKLAELDVTTITQETRAKLEITKDDTRPIVAFYGQLDKTGQTLMDFVAGLNAIGEEIILIARPHPRMKANAPEEYELWHHAMERFKAGVTVDSWACTTLDVVATADLNASMFSTTSMYAACLGKPNISLLYNSGQKAFDKAFDGHLKEFPLITLGCSRKASNHEELVKLLAEFNQTKNLGLKPQQDKIFPLGGNNAERIADFVVSLII